MRRDSAFFRPPWPAGLEPDLGAANNSSVVPAKAGAQPASIRAPKESGAAPARGAGPRLAPGRRWRRVGPRPGGEIGFVPEKSYVVPPHSPPPLFRLLFTGHSLIGAAH